jgi:imidazole glycerol-phosphate synthase subunit HisH
MIAIVDYGAGNLASVKKAFEHLGRDAVVTRDPRQVANADKIVLPGVGHFASTKTLDDTGLRGAIVEGIERGVPFLGICVGMQWMLTSSDESPDVSGLGLWPDKCQRFAPDLKSPHVGWNDLKTCADGSSRLMRDVPSESFVYFTHSYAVPLLAATVAECEYGERFSAAIERQNVFGVQFHPEKSSVIGLRILENFCRC